MDIMARFRTQIAYTQSRLNQVTLLPPEDRKAVGMTPKGDQKPKESHLDGAEPGIEGDSEDEAEVMAMQDGGSESSPKETPPKRQRKRPQHFSCDTCGKVVTSRHSLDKHMIQHIPAEERAILICDLCGKTFPAKQYLKQHVDLMHRHRTSEECPVCHKYFFSLKGHMKRVHGGAQTRKECPICGKEVVCLSSHMQTHKARNVVCQECGKAFVTESHLKEHMAAHKGERVRCEYCPHTSTDKRNLNTHIRLRHSVEHEAQKAKRFSQPVARA